MDLILLYLLIFVVGLLYSSVGHAGASGYLAAMALFGLSPESMKPSALVLNILVASIASLQFKRSGHFSWRTFWPFAISSIPFSFIGGTMLLSAHIYRHIVGIVLLFSAYYFFRRRQSARFTASRPMPIYLAIFAGAGIGLLSGIIGIGGGIFLTPLILFIGWAGTKETAAISAVFILMNSISGLAGHIASVKFLPEGIFIMAFAALFGGVIGSSVGSRHLANPTLYSLLAIILIIAGVKFLII